MRGGRGLFSNEGLLVSAGALPEDTAAGAFSEDMPSGVEGPALKYIPGGVPGGVLTASAGVPSSGLSP
jgi:hypothetical protein